MDACSERKDSRRLPTCRADAVPWLTVEQMRDVDRVAIDIGLDLARMMENAGGHLAAAALAMLGGDARGRRVTVLCGRGGNGGGGLVAARRLIGWGAEVEVRLSDPPDRLAPVPREQLEILRATGAPITVGATGLAAADLFVDALLGYSQRGAPHGGAAELIAATAGGRMLALDVPSGLLLEDGSIADPAVRAEVTLTLAVPKTALRGEHSQRLVGELHLADIGIPPSVFRRLAIPFRSPFSQGPVVRILLPRGQDSATR
jgi:NAD(P)H-hydrate epimerase